MKLRPCLRSYSNSSKKAEVKIFYSEDSDNTYLDTGIEVTTGNFNTGRIEGTKLYTDVYAKWIKPQEPSYKSKNDNLARQVNEFQAWLFEYRAAKGSYPSAREVKELYSNRSAATYGVTLEQLKEDYLNYAKTKDRHPIGYSTLKNYKPFFEHLGKFAPIFNPDKINAEWIRDYKVWLKANTKVVNENSIAGYIGKLKAFLRFLIETKRTTLSISFVRNLDDSKSPRDIIWFTHDELQKIYNANFYDKEKYPRLWDRQRKDYTRYCHRFFILLSTGLRKSDLKAERLQWVTYKDKDGETKHELHVKPLKTENTSEALATIPLSPECYAITRLYEIEGGVPKSKNRSVELDTYKKIGELLEIDTPVRLIYGRRTSNEGDIVPKWKLMTPQSCRSHFACVRLNRGMSKEVIAAQMGITTETLDKSYATVSNTYIREEAKKFHDGSPSLTYSVNEENLKAG